MMYMPPTWVLAHASVTAADSPWVQWLQLEDPARRWLVVFGLLGQTVFFCRWIVQWWSSERAGDSHVPELFWWCSLLGAMMLLTYFIIDRDPVGIVGQGVGWAVYARNLWLIRMKRPAADEVPAAVCPACGHALGRTPR